MLQPPGMQSTLSRGLSDERGDPAAGGVSPAADPRQPRPGSAASLTRGDRWLGTTGTFMPSNHANLSPRSPRAVPAQGARSG